MNQNSYYSINSTIELKFDNSHVRDISYNSFLPELKQIRSKRSQIKMEKENNSPTKFRLEYYLKHVFEGGYNMTETIRRTNEYYERGGTK